MNERVRVEPPQSPPFDRELDAPEVIIGRATTAGYGPRFLHSTGQLHKGGAPTGWFLQLTADHPDDLEIPGWPYSIGRLIDAQAAGDFAAIESHDLPILRVDLGADPAAGLAILERGLAAALSQAPEA